MNTILMENKEDGKTNIKNDPRCLRMLMEFNRPKVEFKGVL
jgi:hypothetical protein